MPGKYSLNQKGPERTKEAVENEGYFRYNEKSNNGSSNGKLSSDEIHVSVVNGSKPSISVTDNSSRSSSPDNDKDKKKTGKAPMVGVIELVNSLNIVPT